MTNSDSPTPAITFRDLTSLSAISSDIWLSLQRAVTDRNCGWRLPVLATRCGDAVRQRTVVLRDVDPVPRRLLAHTDRRSPKFAQLRSHPAASWLFYDHPAATQLVITGQVTLHTDDALAADLWSRESESSLRGYLGAHAPGTAAKAASHNLPDQWQGRVPAREDLQSARDHFAVICCHVDTIEWLHLKRDGNLRARFFLSESADRAQAAHPTAEWLHP